MILILVGTRPEIIKMSPVIKELERRHVPFTLVHSGQHYSAELDQVFFTELKLPIPTYNLTVGSGSHAQQTAKILVEFEKCCEQVKPSIVLVHGDTNTALSGALVAKKLLLPLGHIEAGLRSGDITMPEEINRKMIDSISDYLYAPTQAAQQNLQRENHLAESIILTGNTIVDAVQQNLQLAHLQGIELPIQPYTLLTAHRPANVDDPRALSQLITLVTIFAKETQTMVIWPIHPRTQHILTDHGINLPPNIQTTKPIGYFEMLQMIEKAAWVLTDSGGVQEEAFILHRPLITLRDSTERPETLTANQLVSLDVGKLLSALNFFQTGQAKWNTSLGEGKASQLIVDHLIRTLKL